MRKLMLSTFAVVLPLFGTMAIDTAHAASIVTTTVPASSKAMTSHQSKDLKLSLSLRWKETATGERRLEAFGRTTYAGTARVHLQVRTATGWAAAGAANVAGHRYLGNVTRTTAPGTKVRATLGSGRQMVTASQATPEELPYHMVLDDPSGLMVEAIGTRLTVQVYAEAGDFVNVVVDDSFTASGHASEGTSRVDGTSGTEFHPNAHFTASVDGTYTVHLTGVTPGPKTIWASTPTTVAGQIGGSYDVSDRRPHQPVDVAFTGQAGALLNLPDLGPDAGELIGPDGTVAPWLSDPQSPDVYRIPNDGDYVLRAYNPDNTIDISSVVSAEAVVGGPDLTVALPNPQDVAVVEIPASVDQPFYVDLASSGGHPMALFGPDGGPAIDAATEQAPVDGVYYLVVGGLEGSPEVTVSVALPHDIIAS